MIHGAARLAGELCTMLAAALVALSPAPRNRRMLARHGSAARTCTAPTRRRSPPLPRQLRHGCDVYVLLSLRSERSRDQSRARMSVSSPSAGVSLPSTESARFAGCPR